MSSKNGSGSIAIIGLIVIAFSITAFFLLDVERAAIFIWALAFLLLSEIILFGGLIGIRNQDEQHGKTFLKTGITVALVLYFITSLIITLFADSFRDRVSAFILIELGAIALFAIITIVIIVVSGRSRR